MCSCLKSALKFRPAFGMIESIEACPMSAEVAPHTGWKHCFSVCRSNRQSVQTRDAQGAQGASHDFCFISVTNASFLSPVETHRVANQRANSTADQPLGQGLERPRQRPRLALARVHAERGRPHRRRCDSKDQVHANSHSGSCFPPRVSSQFSFR